MLFLSAAVGTFLLVNLLCACVALGVGFAAGVWFFGARLSKPANQAPPEKPKPEAKFAPQPKPAATAEKSVERAILATHRVADVAQNIVGDVGDHAAKMQAISADLQGIDHKSSGASAEVSAALDKILAANAELQRKLEQAEKQIAAQAAEIKAHESEARTDSLTGLNNRRAFDDELKRRLSEWERKNSPCTLILLDVDHFKKFNDTHGHQAGDEVLRQVAKTLIAQSRDMDLPCRYGGEEFAVILPATEAAGACILAERIRKAVESSVTAFGGKSLKVTVSLGLSQLAAGDDVAKLIRRADDALYKSKEAGRNCGHWNTGETFVPITAAAQVAAADAKVTRPSATAASEEPANPIGPLTPTEQRTATGTHFIHMLKRRVAESHRFGIPLSIMHLKIEDYDNVVRNHGKAIARQMVDAAAPVLEKVLREMDVLAQLENGEFVAMLPGNTQAEAGQIAKRMKVTMNSCSVPMVDRELHVRIRHCVTELMASETAQELLARAKQSLHGAAGGKAASRSPVHL
jgi:diguanylate cyclase